MIGCNANRVQSPWALLIHSPIDNGWRWIVVPDSPIISNPLLCKAGDLKDAYYHVAGKPTTS